MKPILTAACLLIAACSPALALEDFSRVRCETPEMKKFILKVLPTLPFNGSTFASYIQTNSISGLSTLSAERNKVVCKLTVEVTYSGTSARLPGRFTLRQFPNGKLSAEWSPLS